MANSNINRLVEGEELEGCGSSSSLSLFLWLRTLCLLVWGKKVRDLIFHNRPYSMVLGNTYITQWTLEFDLEVDVPSIVPV